MNTIYNSIGHSIWSRAISESKPILTIDLGFTESIFY
jgi:hypothetical protein